MDLIVIAIQGKRGQIRTRIHTKIHTHTHKQKTKKTNKQPGVGGGIKRGKWRTQREKKERGQKETRKREGVGLGG